LGLLPSTYTQAATHLPRPRARPGWGPCFSRAAREKRNKSQFRRFRTPDHTPRPRAHIPHLDGQAGGTWRFVEHHPPKMLDRAVAGPGVQVFPVLAQEGGVTPGLRRRPQGKALNPRIPSSRGGPSLRGGAQRRFGSWRPTRTRWTFCNPGGKKRGPLTDLRPDVHHPRPFISRAFWRTRWFPC